MRAIVAAAMLVLSGCAQGYQQFYTDLHQNGSGYPVTPPRTPPTIVPGSGDANRDVAEMWRQGYTLIGYSAFNGPFDANGVLVQARRVGAERVMRYARETSTERGAIALPTTQAVTTYQSGSATAVGSGGFATGTYNGVSTTYVPSTTYIPYSVTRYDQTALYFAPVVRPCLGALLTSPTDDQMRAVGTNSAALVIALRDGSPAYNANILPGDLLLTVGGVPITQTAGSWANRSGQTYQIALARPTNENPHEYRRMEVSLAIPPCDF